jgi:hypothetical protein
MITIPAPFGFPESHVPQKAFYIIVFLANDLKVHVFGIRVKRFLPFKAFGVGMDVVSVKKASNAESIRTKRLNREYGTGRAADMK